MITKNDSIFVAGHNGMVGSAIFRELQTQGFNALLTATRSELDLTRQSAVETWMTKKKPAVVIIAAAKVGGIHANNTYPADFIYDNLMIESNLIHAAFKEGCKQVILLGSSCIYPKFANQPMTESELLQGTLEPTNEAYAVAKIAGIKLCESYNRQHDTDFRSLMPTNLYGPNDNYHEENSHVIPAMIRRFHEAKAQDLDEVAIWGSGTPKREFLYVDDLAKACIALMLTPKAVWQKAVEPMQSHINVGTGVDISIKDLAEVVKKTVGFEGAITLDSSKPDGTPRKLLDVSVIKSLGWSPDTSLEEGLKLAYDWFLNNSYRES